MARPKIWLQPTTAREADGKDVSLARFRKHLLCDEDGLFPEDFNLWENRVVLAELQRPGNIAWYRNPARASQDSLGVTYEDSSEIKVVRPDFIFFNRQQNGAIVADIVDPHGLQFGDALPKLRGLARYAEKNPGVYRRIEVVAEVGGNFRTIDLTEASTRAAVFTAKNAKEIYEGDGAIDYFT